VYSCRQACIHIPTKFLGANEEWLVLTADQLAYSLQLSMGIFYRPKKAPNYLAGLSELYCIERGKSWDGWYLCICTELAFLNV
jgi:hypothetical protein